MARFESIKFNSGKLESEKEKKRKEKKKHYSKALGADCMRYKPVGFGSLVLESLPTLELKTRLLALEGLEKSYAKFINVRIFVIIVLTND